MDKLNRSRPRERFIFWYNDGSKERGIDPLEAQHSLLTDKEFDFNVDLKLMQTTTPEAPLALRRLIAAVRRTFEVKPYDGVCDTGLTGSECVELFVRFAALLDSVKKKVEDYPISSQPTEPMLSAVDSPQPSDLDSNSTSNDSSIVSPQQPD